MLEEACHWETDQTTVEHARQLLQALLLAIGFDTLEAAEAVYPFILDERIEGYLEDEACYLEDEAHDDEDDDDVTVACATDDDSDDSTAHAQY